MKNHDFQNLLQTSYERAKNARGYEFLVKMTEYHQFCTQIPSLNVHINRFVVEKMKDEALIDKNRQLLNESCKKVLNSIIRYIAKVEVESGDIMAKIDQIKSSLNGYFHDFPPTIDNLIDIFLVLYESGHESFVRKHINLNDLSFEASNKELISFCFQRHPVYIMNKNLNTLKNSIRMHHKSFEWGNLCNLVENINNIDEVADDEDEWMLRNELHQLRSGDIDDSVIYEHESFVSTLDTLHVFFLSRLIADQTSISFVKSPHSHLLPCNIDGSGNIKIPHKERKRIVYKSKYLRYYFLAGMISLVDKDLYVSLDQLREFMMAHKNHINQSKNISRNMSNKEFKSMLGICASNLRADFPKLKGILLPRRGFDKGFYWKIDS